MTRVDFYHLQRSTLEDTLPKLAQLSLKAGHKVLLKTSSLDRLDELNTHLWTFDAHEWLPHGSKKDGFVDKQPLYMTVEDDNPNEADLLILTDGADCSDLSPYVRCLDIFDGNSEIDKKDARQRWKRHLDTGLTLYYWQQDEMGRWIEKASANTDDEKASDDEQ